MRLFIEWVYCLLSLWRSRISINTKWKTLNCAPLFLLFVITIRTLSFAFPKASCVWKVKTGNLAVRNTKLGMLSSQVLCRLMQTFEHVGKIPRSKKGNSFILVVVDTLSIFSWHCPVLEPTTTTTIKVLKSVVLQNFGFLETIISDNPLVLLQTPSKTFSACMRHSTLFTYDPQPSHAERINRNLKAALITYHANSQSTWDSYIPRLQLTFNSVYHEAHHNNPFEIIFKFSPNSPFFLAWKINELLLSKSKDIITMAQCFWTVIQIPTTLCRLL